MAKVFIFGAGASKALNDGAPLMDSLSLEVFKLARSRSNHYLSELHDFIEELYPHLSKDGWLSIQDMLSLLDSLIFDKKNLSTKYNLDRLKQVREGLTYAMLNVIRTKLRENWSTNDGINTFVDIHVYLTSFWSYIENGDTFISLNYDLVLDNHLRDALRNNEVLKNSQSPFSDKSLDYGFQPRFVYSTQKKPKARYQSDKRIQLLKLHGSLNWLYCPKCQKIDVTEGAKGTIVNIYESKDVCPNCNEPYQPVIITPTLLKQYDNPKIQEVWKLAENVLQNADKVIFVGYSLPDADIVLRTMFTQSFYLNRVKAPSRNLAIEAVDFVKEPDRDTKKKTDVYERYDKNFGSISYDWTGFTEYIDRGCIIKPVKFINP